LYSHFAKAFDGGVLAQSHAHNRNPEGETETPIYIALKSDKIELARLLISAGADVNAGCT
jgi:hypothetical protein